MWGTAKVTPRRLAAFRTMVDILQPDELFSVADFTALAGALEHEISSRGHLPSSWAAPGSMSRVFCMVSALLLRKRRTVCGNSWPQN